MYYFRTLLNKATFQKLPSEYQYKLSRLLPQVDTVTTDQLEGAVRVVQSGLTNEFFTKVYNITYTVYSKHKRCRIIIHTCLNCRAAMIGKNDWSKATLPTRAY